MSQVRVVSLVPSATETLVALGVTPVACTRFCDLPGARTVGGTKNVDVDAVAALDPDLVVVNNEENRIEDAEALAARGLVLHSMSPRSVLDVGAAVRQLAAAVGVPAPERFGVWDAWVARTGRPVHARAFVPIWRRPWMSLAADTYGSSLLAHCGIVNVCDGAMGRYPEIALSDVARLEPEIVILPSEPYAFAPRHAEEVHAVLPGVPVIFTDGRDLFWWGIRTPDAAARLRKTASVTGVRVAIDDLERGDLPALSVKTGRPCANPVAVVLRPKLRPWSASAPNVASILPIEPGRVRARRLFTRVSWVLLVVAGAGLVATFTGAGAIASTVAIVGVLGYAATVAVGEWLWVGARPGARAGELVLRRVHREFASAVDAQYGR